jgi:hypothetical protein
MNKLKEAAQRMVDAFAPHADMCRPCTIEWQNLREALAQQEWAGLTDEEIKEIVGPYGDTPIKGYTRKLFDQIEAKLKEKNT